MAEYIEKEKLLTDINNGIKAGNYEEGYEQYQNINNMDDIIETIKYSDTADVIERSKIDKAIEEIESYEHGNGNMFTCGLEKAVEILKRNIGE